MVALGQRRLRAAAALCATLLFAQLTALPLVHVAHIAAPADVSFVVGGAAAGDAVVHGAARSHDAATCAVCGILAQCRAGALPADVVRPVPPRAVTAVSDLLLGGHFGCAPSTAAARAPPPFLA